MYLLLEKIQCVIIKQLALLVAHPGAVDHTVQGWGSPYSIEVEKVREGGFKLCSLESF